MIRVKLHHPVPPKMNCTATALCAVTNKSAAQVENAIREASGDSTWSVKSRIVRQP